MQALAWPEATSRKCVGPPRSGAGRRGSGVAVGPGATLRIPRGVRNDSAGTASCRYILTPGVPGPGYFRAVSYTHLTLPTM